MEVSDWKPRSVHSFSVSLTLPQGVSNSSCSGSCSRKFCLPPSPEPLVPSLPIEVPQREGILFPLKDLSLSPFPESHGVPAAPPRPASTLMGLQLPPTPPFSPIFSSLGNSSKLPARWPQQVPLLLASTAYFPRGQHGACQTSALHNWQSLLEFHRGQDRCSWN